MKKATFFLLFVSNIYFANSQSGTLQVQDSSSMTAQRFRDTCFGLLNLSASQVSSGYLLDYSISAFNDSLYNSLISSKLDTINDAGTFFSLHNILSSSVVNSNASSIGLTDSLFINANRYLHTTGNIPLLFLFQAYQKIRATALSQGLFNITTDSLRLMDVAGRTTSPYDTRYFFGFTPLQNNITQFGTLNFSLPAQFWLMPGITTVQIDFGDGTGFRTLSQNGTVAVNYNSSGTYYLVANISTASGNFTAKSSIQYTQPTYYSHADTTWHVSVAPLYTTVSSYLSAHGMSRLSSSKAAGSLITPCSDGSIFDAIYCTVNPGAKVYIETGCDRVFDKPIIIVEGFDPTNSLTLEKFKLYFQTRPTNSSLTTFYSTMRAQGYDFVFVFFDKTTDWIENNALVLEQVIQKVNATKTGNNKSTVIGVSMGGLVARWALKDMEDNGIPHQVANYFSYDSPHQGANVPLGLQVLFNEVLNDMPYLKYLPSVKQNFIGYTSYAAQQMLNTYISFSNGQLNPSVLNPVRTAFAQSLAAKGYPQTTANYGISLGRGNNTNGTTNAGVGTQFGFGPGSAIFTGGATFVLENFVGIAYAAPVNTTDYICKYHFSGLKIKGLFLLNTPYWGIRVVNIKYAGLYPYDDAPGGFENTQSEFVKSLNSYRGLSPNATNNGHYGHNFIPVASALDLQNQSYGATNNYQSANMYYTIDNNIVRPGNTLSPATLSPFKSVLTYTSDCSISGEKCESYDPDVDKLLAQNNITQDQLSNWNQYHEAVLSVQAQTFIQRTLLNTTTFPSCTGTLDFCNFTGSISGPTVVCINTNNNIFTVSGASYNGINMQWSFKNGLMTVVSGQGTPQITTKCGSATGNETIILLMTNTCGQQITITYNVHIGGFSSSDYPVAGPSSVCKNSYATYSTNALAGATSYTWFWPGSWTSVTGQGTPTLNVRTSTASGPVGVRVANMCDAGGSPAQVFVQVMTTCGNSNVIVSPNPSNGILQVSMPAGSTSSTATQGPDSKTPIPDKIYAIQIIDQLGNIKKAFTYKGGLTQTTINVSDLSNGNYILKIFNNSTWSNTEIIIIK